MTRPDIATITHGATRCESSLMMRYFNRHRNGMACGYYDVHVSLWRDYSCSKEIGEDQRDRLPLETGYCCPRPAFHLRINGWIHTWPYDIAQVPKIIRDVMHEFRTIVLIIHARQCDSSFQFSGEMSETPLPATCCHSPSSVT